VARVFDMLIRDVYKRTRRQSRASSQDPSSTTSPVGGRGLPVPPTGAATDPARLARFLQPHHSPYSQRSSSHPRQTPASDGENVRDPRDYRLIRDISEARQNRRAGQAQAEEMNWAAMMAQVAIPVATAAREEDKDEESVVETRDLGLGTVVV
jgi:hypothetical protein